MPSEQLIQAVMRELGGLAAGKRENLLTALLGSKLARGSDGAIDVVMDPDFARMVQPILDDENARDAAIEALLRLGKQDKKESKWLGLFRRR